MAVPAGHIRAADTGSARLWHVFGVAQMSEVSGLTKLASFNGRSELSSADRVRRRRALQALTTRLDGGGPRRTVSELLAVVMTLSARTRRMAMPAVIIDLDVFSPLGKRAVRLRLPRG
jgi:hypothetical protein